MTVTHEHRYASDLVPPRAGADAERAAEDFAATTTTDDTTRAGGAAGARTLTTPRAATATGGEPLGPAERAYFEPRLGHELDRVRLHRDDTAAARAAAVGARAFTVGTDVYLGRDAPAPHTPTGRRFLAHELAHVVQQRAGLALQRNPLTTAPGQIPADLNTSVNLREMTDQELAERHDRVLEVLAGFDQSTPDTAILDQHLGEIGAELSRRAALAAGRTFADADIERMRDYFQKNAKTEKDSCIVCLNKGLRLVTGQSTLPTTPETIEKTMAKVGGAGYAGAAREIWMTTATGRVTRGAARPAGLAESIWDAVVSMAGGDSGWSVFTMSLLDGYHSVTLTLESTAFGKRIYWSDQWSSKGGWKEYDRKALDAEVVSLIQGWWDGQAVGKKHTTVIRLWRVSAKPQNLPTP